MNILEVLETEVYARWFSRIRDRRAKTRILIRIRRLSLGHPGDVSSVGGGVYELRIHSGPGYRVYFEKRGNTKVVLLAGGTKNTQRRDIARAREIAEEV